MELMLFGAVINRFRGGGIFNLAGETDEKRHTQIRRVTYCMAGAFVVWWFHRFDTWQVFTILYLSLLTGWGRPIGAAGGWEDKELVEFPPFDFVLRPLRRAASGIVDVVKEHQGEAEYFYENNYALQLWGVSWLTLWGLCVGLALAFSLGSAMPILSFGSMGVVYWLVFRFYEWQGKKASQGWETAELVFGAVSFLGLAS